VLWLGFAGLGPDMSASLVLRALLVIVAIMGVSLKVANGMVAAPAAPSRLSDHTKHQLEQQLATFLERESFRVDKSQQDTDFHLAVVKATRDECRLLIAIVSPKGDQRAFLTELAAPGDQVSFVFQGKIYKEQPIWRPLIHQYLVRQLQNYAGIRSPSSPVVGMIASPTCDLSGEAWSAFAVGP
jgi:hypothetical protein